MFIPILFILFVGFTHNACPYDAPMQLLKNDLSYFYQTYHSPTPQKLIDRLYSLEATVQTGWLICDNHTEINPEGNYRRNTSNCLIGMDELAEFSMTTANKSLTEMYTILNKTAAKVFQTGADCREVMMYKGWTNISSDCKDGIKSHNDLITSYENDIILGGNGTKYLQDLVLKTEQQRKACDFNVLTRATKLSNDTCYKSNIEWFYPIADVFQSSIQKQNYLNYTGYFYLFYQSVGRAQTLCNSTHLEQE